MKDETQLQVKPKDDGSSLTLAKAQSGLIARGRRDAAELTVKSSAPTIEQPKTPWLEGICNKCGERREMVLDDCVCASCRDRLDKDWAGDTAMDWVLVAPEGPNSFNRTISEALVAQGKAPRDDRIVRYIYLNTTYTQMRSHWATCNWPCELCAGIATPDDMAHMRAVCTDLKPERSANHDSMAIGPFCSWPRSRLTFIRPASEEEIAEQRVTPRGACNKCGEHKRLTVAGCVCETCGQLLDEQWASSTVTDWILVMRSDIIRVLKQSLRSTRRSEEEDVSQEEPDPFARHLFRHTTYDAIKLFWAKAECGYSMWMGYASSGDVATLRSNWARPQESTTAFIRPATLEELEEYDRYRVSRVVEQTFEKWGFDDEGQPFDGFADDETTLRLAQAKEEIGQRLKQLGLS